MRVPALVDSADSRPWDGKSPRIHASGTSTERSILHASCDRLTHEQNDERQRTSPVVGQYGETDAHGHEQRTERPGHVGRRRPPSQLIELPRLGAEHDGCRPPSPRTHAWKIAGRATGP